MLQIQTEQTEVIEAGTGAPAPRYISPTQIGESLEATLVALEGIMVGSVNPYNEFIANDEAGNTFQTDPSFK
jgi:hypothetical protein